ncbi:hypothetical protein [Virgibacillus salexigens]|uniref:Uncharacterized protein n=1 Tax=Virgibacillus kapii TaxID=1638645 RepID=A0ABQ2D724_9BACI|nr:hypothetical protein [Virgibacillus kapii]GGJ48406.1 hypothetical protein GCM10007111_08100 [Virgibacillus kapii]
MNEELKRLAQDFIILPFAAKIFEQDRKRFAKFKQGIVYQSMIDAVIERIQKDMSATKQKLYTKYHLDIKRIGNTTYRWNSRGNSGVIEYSSDDLKEMTSQTMKRYMKGTDFEIKEGFIDQVDKLKKEKNPH